MSCSTKTLIVIAGLVASIATAAALWKLDKAEEDAAWERATIPRDNAPSAQRPITEDDLFGSGDGSNER
ncbi:hypothetical protein HPA02_16020 [Bisbaumannia pacifica]|uniref:Uncharacterized protein n=1 Tax=Bisbaumannia pacifica TaxID=77098 RepID=A0A510X7B8_9GAMM|nr:hypothetical protein HPA02_16020 [Halomonas pacifica]